MSPLAEAIDLSARCAELVVAFGPPGVDALGPTPYCALNTMLDPAFPSGALSYWQARFLTDLSDDAIPTLVGAFEACPSPVSHIIIEHLHGAGTRVPVEPTRDGNNPEEDAVEAAAVAYGPNLRQVRELAK